MRIPGPTIWIPVRERGYPVGFGSPEVRLPNLRTVTFQVNLLPFKPVELLFSCTEKNCTFSTTSFPVPDDQSISATEIPDDILSEMTVHTNFIHSNKS